MQQIEEFPKIDAHIHFNANRRNILQLADTYNFDLLTINTEVPDFPSIAQQRHIAKEHQQDEPQLFYTTTVDTQSIFENGWVEETIKKVRNDISKGACGVKFWKNIGMSIQRSDGSFLMLDDPLFEPLFDFLEKQQITVLGHQGEPKNCWLPVEEMTVRSDREYFGAHPQYHMYKHDKYPDYWKHIEARDTILERHPNLQFVGLHLASLEWSLDKIIQRLERYPNLAVDLAERISHLYYHTAENRGKVIDFFHAYQDRIIYGTDIIDDPNQDPGEINKDLQERWTSHWQYFTSDDLLNSSQIEDSFRGLALPESILEKIYRSNALNWYQL